MKVSELQGELLDMWVAKAEGNMIATHTHCGTTHYTLYFYSGDTPAVPKYSTDWEGGGPILARMIESGEYCVWENYECVTVSNHDPEGIPCKEPRRWDVPEAAGRGPTLLIAMCRALVMAKFGEEVNDETI